jgi:hypothetical protein
MTVLFALVFGSLLLILLFFGIRLTLRKPAFIVPIGFIKRRIMIRVWCAKKRIEEFCLDYFVR